MVVQLHSFTIVFVVSLSFLLFASKTCMRCDDVFMGEQNREFGVLQNGDPALLSIVLEGKSIYEGDQCQNGCPENHNNNNNHKGDRNVASTAASTTSASERSKSDNSVNNKKQNKSNGVLAVTVIGSPSLPNGTLTNAFKERLLHGLRTALLTGSPWLVIPCKDEERNHVEEFFTQLLNPSEVLFPEYLLSLLPPAVQPLARQLRDSMAFEMSLLQWLRRGRVVRRLEYSINGDETVMKREKKHEEEENTMIMSMKQRETLGNKVIEDTASPRMMRYGASTWIIPAIVWDDNNNNNNENEEMETNAEVERAAELLQQRILHARAYDERVQEGLQSTENLHWLKKECFDIVVVSGMYNEVYAKALFAKALRRLWTLPYAPNISRSPHSYHYHQKQYRQHEPLAFLAECVRVRVTSADDPMPDWIIPTPLLVSGPSPSSFGAYAGSLARFFGTYSHAIYVNYKRWYNCLHASLVSYGVLSFLNEVCILTGAVLSGTLSLQEITRAAFIRG
ncbi:uncharacterized protein TM35_000431560 [Trypanosoma theileri]|uniref:Uncharacterized protein n=1 Tax=Trypanosoma theileri TaxID=67003 RepID=A0A1X0NJA5_9TRYP|nr:uncharacterized protein TM35_000431560 [Trypanosoma theileri]ORC84588.1 hypothetical protein TM35_000431560 [Trypanosoma theileri]